MTRLPTTRGRIIARDGTELATFAEATQVGVVPGQIKSEAGLLASLAPLVGLKAEDIKAKYTQSWVRPDTYVAIRTIRDLSADARARLAVIEGVQLRPERVRAYPSGILAHQLGGVGEATDDDAKKLAARGVAAGDVIGKTGLEATLEEQLGGTFGWRLGIVDENERLVETLAETPAVPGLDAVLSIDTAMQRAAEAQLATRKGAVVVEDAWTGEILVLASGPKAEAFDRAMFGQYATGSSFKMITAAAALRTGALKPGELVDCPQRWTGFGPQWVQVNHESSALGPIDLRTALARSCNTFFYELGKRLNDKDPNLLPNAARSFGLGSATDIDFVFEAAGIVPSPDWKKQRFPNSPADQVWNPGDATNLAIGQGFLLATPIQMANYVSAVTNDGIVWKPRVVVELRDRSGIVTRTFAKQELRRAETKPTDLQPIRDGMRAVVSDPQGTVYFPFLGYQVPVAGKSGTAETSAAGKVNAWFIGFAPFDVPRYAFAAVLDGFEERPGVHGSQDSARIARAVLAAKLGGTP
jgi:penicillin-binding protein 2